MYALDSLFSRLLYSWESDKESLAKVTVKAWTFSLDPSIPIPTPENKMKEGVTFSLLPGNDPLWRQSKPLQQKTPLHFVIEVYMKGIT